MIINCIRCFIIIIFKQILNIPSIFSISNDSFKHCDIVSIIGKELFTRLI